jgi:outer membrane protein insertion porin family
MKFRVRVGAVRKLGAAAALSLLVAFGVIGGAVMSAQPAAAQVVSAVVVEGNQRVDAETIRSYVRIRPGERADPVRVDEALKALYATGIFEDVQIRYAGGRLIVSVREAQVINRVVFEGNRKIKDETFNTEVQSKPRASLSRPTVQADVQRIVEIYRRSGRYNVTVEPQLIDRPNNRVDLIFVINEGEQTTIRTINFSGNNVFSSARLRDVINTTQTNWISFLRNTNVYDPDRVNADQELLRRYYLKNGYADFRIINATVDLDRANNGFVLNFVLDEGPQYRFGSTEVISNVRDVDGASLRGLIRTNPGDVYNAELVEKSVELLTIELAKRGYAFAQVRPRGDRDFQNRRINVIYVIEEGPRVYVERINVRNNTRTREYVIRREFELVEGDPYNRVLVDRAERRLKNLGYFKTVRITNEAGSAPDRVILNVDVEEQLTGEFSVAVGFSSTDGVLGELTIGERNFLGRGQYVRTSLQYGERNRGVEFSFTEPYFMDYRLAVGFDVFYREQDPNQFVQYGINTIGGTVRAGMRLNEEITVQLRYTGYQREIVTNPGLVDGCAFNTTTLVGVGPSCAGFTLAQIQAAGLNQFEVSNAIRQVLGETITSMVGYSIIYNSLDNNREPTTGFYINFSQDLAGVGGDTQFLRTTFDGRMYRPLTGDFVGMIRVQAGHIFAWGGDALRITDHFNNASSLVRGFATQGFGARDLNLNLGFNDSLGGTTYWAASAEIQFPLWFLPKEIGVKSALFVDVGSLFGYDGTTNVPGGIPASCAPGSAGTNVCLFDANTVRASAGVSFIWASPFGPLRFDLAYPILKDQYDRTQFFRFGAGTRF